MAYEQKDNTGALFKNEKKTTDTQPNATGSALIDGVAYFCDAWTNTSDSGAKYQTLKFKRKDKQTGAPLPRAATASPRAAVTAFDDEDLPPF